MVVMPSVEEEDLRRCHRERDRLIRERTAHINRIKGLLFGQGIRGINVKSRYKTLTPAALVTGDGRPLPESLGREITRDVSPNCKSPICANPKLLTFWLVDDGAPGRDVGFANRAGKVCRCTDGRSGCC